MSQGKSFDISKWEVWEAYRRVKANKGAPGVDGQTIAEFETARDKYGVIFPSFLPAVSREALKAMGQRVRRWRIHRQVSSDLADLARWMNPIVRGWMQYYGRFYRTELYPILQRINSWSHICETTTGSEVRTAPSELVDHGTRNRGVVIG